MFLFFYLTSSLNVCFIVSGDVVDLSVRSIFCVLRAMMGVNKTLHAKELAEAEEKKKAEEAAKAEAEANKETVEDILRDIRESLKK